MPPKHKSDQSAPAPVSPTGVPDAAPVTITDSRAQAGEFLTGAQGVRVDDTDHSLKAGRRGTITPACAADLTAALQP